MNVNSLIVSLKNVFDNVNMVVVDDKLTNDNINFLTNNFDGLTPSDKEDIKDTLAMNFIRYYMDKENNIKYIVYVDDMNHGYGTVDTKETFSDGSFCYNIIIPYSLHRINKLYDVKREYTLELLYKVVLSSLNYMISTTNTFSLMTETKQFLFPSVYILLTEYLMDIYLKDYHSYPYSDESLADIIARNPSSVSMLNEFLFCKEEMIHVIRFLKETYRKFGFYVYKDLLCNDGLRLMYDLKKENSNE